MARKLGYSLPGLRLDMQNAPTNQDMMSLGLLIQSDIRVDSGKSTQQTMNVLAGVCEAARSLNASITVHHVPLADRDKIADREFQPPALQQGLLTGVVLHNYFPPKVIARLVQQVPCVAISYDYSAQSVDCVDLDATYAVTVLMDRLYALGHRRIGFLGELNYVSWSQARLAGYLQSLIRLKLPYDPAIVSADMDSTGITPEDIDHILDMTRSGVTAWLAVSDTAAWAWYRIFTAQGLRIPEDVSLVCIGSDSDPPDIKPLTSIHSPYDEMGKNAVKLLIERVREPLSPIRRLCMKGRLVEGRTIAPPRSSSVGQ